MTFLLSDVYVWCHCWSEVLELKLINEFRVWNHNVVILSVSITAILTTIMPLAPGPWPNYLSQRVWWFGCFRVNAFNNILMIRFIYISFLISLDNARDCVSTCLNHRFCEIFLYLARFLWNQVFLPIFYPR